MIPDMEGDRQAVAQAAGFARGVFDAHCPRGCVLDTPTDHRLLWSLENILAVSGNAEVRTWQQRLRQYLNVTCQHHWHDFEGDEYIAAHRQCLWCSDVEWVAEVTS